MSLVKLYILYPKFSLKSIYICMFINIASSRGARTCCRYMYHCDASKCDTVGSSVFWIVYPRGFGM
jgi:hypothetical protein